MIVRKFLKADAAAVYIFSCNNERRNNRQKNIKIMLKKAALLGLIL